MSPSPEWDVYALSATPLARQMRVGRRALRVFHVGPIDVFAGALRTRDVTTEQALREQHDLVVALADRVDPLLPFRFGSRATAERLQATIRPSIPALLEALAHVRGRRQLTLRVFGPPLATEPGSPATTGTDYLVQRAAARDVPPEAAPLRAAVAPFVIDERIQAGRGRIRVTMFHLVAVGNVAKYTSAVNSARIHPETRQWRVALSGPWPPFAFAPDLLA